MSTHISCPCCQAVAHPVGPLPPGLAFAGRVLPDALPGGMLYRCPACTLAFRAPHPPPEALNDLYRAGETTHWRYDVADRIDWQIALRYIAARPPGTVLDVGCFDGTFLSLMPGGWDTYGVEVDGQARARAAARGVTMVGMDAVQTPRGGPYDVITAFDLVEHLPNPLALLRSWKTCVIPGGLLIVATGNADAWSWRFMGSRYWYCAIPEHLAFISPTWCRWAAQELGLELVSLESYSHAPRATRVEQIHEATLNAMHRIVPPLFRRLARFRNRNIAGRSVVGADDTPALWMSASDHLLAVFRVPD